MCFEGAGRGEGIAGHRLLRGGGEGGGDPWSSATDARMFMLLVSALLSALLSPLLSAPLSALLSALLSDLFLLLKMSNIAPIRDPKWVQNRSWRPLGGSRNLFRRPFASWRPLGALLDASGAEKN